MRTRVRMHIQAAEELEGVCVATMFMRKFAIVRHVVTWLLPTAHTIVKTKNLETRGK